jgi:hypothetical protein
MFKKSICLIASAMMCVGFCTLTTTGCGGGGGEVTSPNKNEMPPPPESVDGGRNVRNAMDELE